MRRKRFASWLLACSTLLLLALGSAFVPETTPSRRVGLGRVDVLEARYVKWVNAYEAGGGDRRMVLPLGAIKGLSPSFGEDVHGSARVDLTTGEVRIEVRGASAEPRLDAWLVSNGRDGSVTPESGDRMARLGSLVKRDQAMHLDVARAWRDGLAFDLVVITRDGKTPIEDPFLIGSTTMFHRVYWAARSGRMDAVLGLPASGGVKTLASLMAPPLSAQIGPNPNPTTALEMLIQRGRAGFFSTTFNGNGRTCGTCHREDNNLTLDADYIAGLPPNDPLFVAEFVPGLANHFSNDLLLRELGLVLVNADGFSDLANHFVMRSVKSVNSLTPNTLQPAFLDETGFAIVERVGWSGDMSPGTGTLREAIIGEIAQHFPKTLGRTTGIDFRLPTTAELDEFEAFQKSLGRDADVDITSANGLHFTSADVERGREIFNNPGPFAPFFNGPPAGAGRCLLCHFNAGAGDLVESAILAFPTLIDVAQVNSNLFTNSNFDTGTEDIPNQPADALVPPSQNPPDGGFGHTPIFRNSVFIGFGNGLAAPGGRNERTFNTPGLVEAADTAPFFHNNAAATIEEAVAFYSTPAFNQSPIGAALPGGINLTLEESTQVAAMLRVLNALENIRSSKDLATRAMTAPHDSAVRDRLLALSASELEDAVQVLQGAGLHAEARDRLRLAAAAERRAQRLRNDKPSTNMLNQAQRLKDEARALIVF